MMKLFGKIRLEGKMKKNRIFCTLLGLCFCFFALAGCGEKKCEHEFLNYSVRVSTCTSTGLIEKRCKLCGKKEYEEVEVLPHTMANGKCTVCGHDQDENNENVVIDGRDKSAFYTFDELYEKMGSLQQVVDKQEFTNIFLNTKLSNVYINQLGRLKATVDDRWKVDYGDIRGEYPFEGKYLKTIYGLQLSGGKVNVLYDDDTIEHVGSIDAFALVANPIIGVLVNRQNVLLMHYQNGSVRAVGKLSHNEMEKDESSLVYCAQEGSGYIVVDAMDRRVQKVIVPPSHLGVSVLSIGGYAFSMCKQLTEVQIAAGIERIDKRAFSGCEALTTVTIPASVTVIGSNAFLNCPKLTKVYYAGTQAQWQQIMIEQMGNQALSNAEIIFQGK